MSLNAQCKAFAKRTCLPELGSYTHDGNYHAALLVEGEEAELFKTFYSDMDYRVAICGEDKLPSVEFKILDANKNVLYSSREANFVRTRTSGLRPVAAQDSDESMRHQTRATPRQAAAFRLCSDSE
jgi:hypothetical protein